MRRHINGPLTLIQVISLIALGMAAWFVLEHWHFVAVIALAALLVTLYLEGVIGNDGDDE